MEKDLLHNDLTRQIIGISFEVFKNMGPGFSEKVYQKAMSKEFDENKIDYAMEVPMMYSYKGKILGHNRIDFLVADKVIVELKVGKFFQKDHVNQVLNYLNCCDYEIGLLILFSPNGAKVKRLIDTKK